MPVSNENNEVRMQRAPETVRMLTALLVLYPSIGAVRLVDGDATIVLEFYLRKRLATFQLREFIKELRQAYDVFDLVCHAPNRVLKIYRADKGRRFSSSRLGTSLDPDSAECLPAVTEEQGNNYSGEVCDTTIDVDREVLERLRPMTFTEYWEGLTEAIECIVVERDIATFTREEAEMLVAIMRESFGLRLVEGVNAFIDDDHMLMESDNFNACLDSMKSYLALNHPEKTSSSAEVIAYRDELRVVVFISNHDKVSADRNSGERACASDNVAGKDNASESKEKSTTDTEH